MDAADGAGAAADLGAAPEPYAVVRRRFERELTSAAPPEAPWPERLAVAIRAALCQAARDPTAARRLVLPVAGRRNHDLGPFTEMVDGLAAALRCGAPAVPRPERTARNLVLRVARQILLHLETRPEEPVTALAPDLIVFALTPYIGLPAARRLAE